MYRNLDLNMEDEIWKDVEGFEKKYQISNMGRVKSLNYRGCKGVVKILKQTFEKDGYLRVGLTKDGKTKTNFIHRLVAQTFIENKENKPCVDHINTIRTDNRVENLRWSTHKENSNNELTKEKIKLRKFSDEWRKNMSEAQKGRVKSEETRQKISESKKGKRCTEETKEKLRAYTGKNTSNYKGFICIFPNGEVTEEMTIKELCGLLRVDQSVVINLVKSGKPYKPRYKRLKHLEGIRIYYYQDYLKLESGDEIA